MRKVTLVIAANFNGYIAGARHEIDWLYRLLSGGIGLCRRKLW